MALAERLGKSLAEVDAMTLEELRLWRAWFDLQRDEARTAAGRRRGAHGHS